MNAPLPQQTVFVLASPAAEDSIEDKNPHARVIRVSRSEQLFGCRNTLFLYEDYYLDTAHDSENIKAVMQRYKLDNCVIRL